MMQLNPKFLAAFSVSALLFASGCGTESTPADANSNNQTAEANTSATDAAQNEVENLASQVAANPTHKDLNSGIPAASEIHDHDGDGIPDHDASEHQDAPATAISPLPPQMLKDGPRIQWELNSSTHHFGEVMQGQKMTHVFDLTSSGTDTLIVKQIKPTCGCTVADLMVVSPDGSEVKYQYGDPLPVGTKLHLAATLDTKGKRGAQSSSINIFSNDVRGPVQLSLKADVSPFFHAAPTFINFATLSSQDTKTEKVVVTVTKGEAVTLSVDTEKLPDAVWVDMEPINPNAEGKSSRWEMHLTVGPGLAEGNLAQQIRVVSDYVMPGGKALPDGTMPVQEFNVTASARVLGVVSYNPQYLSMGLVRPGQVLSRTVRIESHDPEFTLGADIKCRIEGIADPKGGFKTWDQAQNFSTTVRAVEGSNAVDVELSLDGMPEGMNGSFRGTMVIELGHPTKPTLEVPITGVCRGGVAKPK